MTRSTRLKILTGLLISSVVACRQAPGLIDPPDTGAAGMDAGDAGQGGMDTGGMPADADMSGSAGAGGSAGAPVDAGHDASNATGGAPGPVLKEAAASSGKLIGAALGASYLSDGPYAATAAGQFNYATPENEMKWEFTEPAQNSFTFASGDAIVAFGQQHGLQVKGHTLVWHAQLPAWVSAITDANQLRAAMINHVFQVGLHYAGQVVAWDVVNEVVADSGQSLRTSVFYNLLGPGFIDDAFNAAHAADPNDRLYLNEYGAEGAGAKSDFVYNLVKGMLSRGVPIHGVGLQMHTMPADASPSAAQVATNMQRLAALGLDVAITEMDVSICASDVDTQGRRFHDIVAVCVAQPACKAVTVWGVSDQHSWLNGMSCATPRPLLFDDSYLAKPAQLGVWNALSGR